MTAAPRSSPEVSVCVWCYNQRRYLPKCLDSVLAQNVDFPVEILVGDDGSTDGSAELIEEYARRDSRIIPICRPQNLPFLENHKDVISRACGEFVAICEGDDYWIDPNKLANQLAVMNGDARLTLAISAGLKVSESGEQRLGIVEIGGPSRELTVGDMIRAVAAVPTASMFMRRSALMSLPAEIYKQPVLDYSLKVLVAARGAVWYDSSVTCAYRVSSIGSWSASLANAEKYLRHHEALASYQHFLERELGPRWTPCLRATFEPVILGFYMSSRIKASDKVRNLATDLPRLSRRGRLAAKLLAHAPALAHAGAFARRRIWAPVARRMRKAPVAVQLPREATAPIRKAPR